jgi:hypothetical protein
LFSPSAGCRGKIAELIFAGPTQLYGQFAHNIDKLPGRITPLYRTLHTAVVFNGCRCGNP